MGTSAVLARACGSIADHRGCVLFVSTARMPGGGGVERAGRPMFRFTELTTDLRGRVAMLERVGGCI